MSRKHGLREGLMLSFFLSNLSFYICLSLLLKKMYQSFSSGISPEKSSQQQEEGRWIGARQQFFPPATCTEPCSKVPGRLQQPGKKEYNLLSDQEERLVAAETVWVLLLRVCGSNGCSFIRMLCDG